MFSEKIKKNCFGLIRSSFFYLITGVKNLRFGDEQNLNKLNYTVLNLAHTLIVRTGEKEKSTNSSHNFFLKKSITLRFT